MRIPNFFLLFLFFYYFYEFLFFIFAIRIFLHDINFYNSLFLLEQPCESTFLRRINSDTRLVCNYDSRVFERIICADNIRVFSVKLKSTSVVYQRSIEYNSFSKDCIHHNNRINFVIDRSKIL